MKNHLLIEKLKQFPDDMEVCIFDVKKNIHFASSDGTSQGIHQSIGVYKIMTDEEAEEIKEECPDFKNFVALEFNSET